MFEKIFDHKTPVSTKLLKYGFTQIENSFVFTKDILEDTFVLKIIITNETQIVLVIDKETDEEYILYKTFFKGTYVDRVRNEIQIILEDVVKNCYKTVIFKQKQTIEMIQHIASKYNDDIEFLWEKSPNNAIVRRKDTKKWYAVFMVIPLNRLQFDSDELVEVINLHATASKVESLLKETGFYPGWHMNKKYWYTIILDGSINNKLLYSLIEESFQLANS